jgi:hypothetical protein
MSMLRLPSGMIADTSHFPPLVGWGDYSLITPAQYLIAARAFCDCGIGERPKGSNRSGRIDAYLRRAKVPESLITGGRGYWCAAWAGAVRADGLLAAGDRGTNLVPPGYADCDTWRPWARKSRRWLDAAAVKRLRTDRQRAILVGGCALFGTEADQSHINVIIRADADYLLGVEGNTSLNGYSRNGTLCDMKDWDFTRLVGVALVHPMAA